MSKPENYREIILNYMQYSLKYNLVTCWITCDYSEEIPDFLTWKVDTREDNFISIGGVMLDKEEVVSSIYDYLLFSDNKIKEAGEWDCHFLIKWEVGREMTAWIKDAVYQRIGDVGCGEKF